MQFKTFHSQRCCIKASFSPVQILVCRKRVIFIELSQRRQSRRPGVVVLRRQRRRQKSEPVDCVVAGVVSAAARRRRAKQPRRQPRRLRGRPTGFGFSWGNVLQDSKDEILYCFVDLFDQAQNTLNGHPLLNHCSTKVLFNVSLLAPFWTFDLNIKHQTFLWYVLVSSNHCDIAKCFKSRVDFS